MMLFGFFMALGISHLLIFLFYRAYKSNLYYFIFIFFLSYFPLGIALQSLATGVHANTLLQLFTILDMPLFFTAFLAFLYSIFYEKFQKQLWIFLAVAGFSIALIFINAFVAVLIIVLVVAGTSVEAIRVIIVANRKRKSGARIIGLGGLFLALFVISMLLLIMISGGLYLKGNEGRLFVILLVLSIICLPLCMSIHLAREFAQTNRSLSKKLKEVEVLSEKTIEQEKEKQKLLETEKDRLEIQVKERTSEISEQKKIIEEKNKDITDSILYAKKIQDAMLPASDVIHELFPESFILFNPKDIVSGDFYWVIENNNYRFIAAADCTGHGVPGALMSMTGNNFLNQIVIERNNSSPASILNELNSAIRKSLKQERSDVESKDGMDIALCCFLPDFPDFSELIFAGANRPLWLVRNNELLEFKADKQAIGGR
ncbi:MAG TPA: SpoIIE family protein phosphatase, partial [Bacteroidia bacterium]|nr:SpoIIE family protein phosphatase [Bacteroidia bacterium]